MHFRLTANLMQSGTKVIALDWESSKNSYIGNTKTNVTLNFNFRVSIRFHRSTKMLSIHCGDILFSVVRSGGEENGDCKKWWGHVTSVNDTLSAYRLNCGPHVHR